MAKMMLKETTMEIGDDIEVLLSELGQGENGFGGTYYGKEGFNIADYITSLQKYSSGIDLEPGYVPQTTFWLTDGSGKIIGISRLRHELTASLLKKGGHIGYYVARNERGRGHGIALLNLTVQKAREIGIERALLTTDSENLASIRAIQRCGGILEDERIDEETGRKYRRYWILTSGRETTEN